MESINISNRQIQPVSMEGPAVCETEPTFLTDRVDEYYNRVAGHGSHILVGREPQADAVMLVSNDYLSLSNHPVMIAAQRDALQASGHGLLRSDVYRTGENPISSFERALAALIKSEATVLTQSGWAANVGLIQSLAGKESPVYLDMMAHTSMWEGVRSAGAQGHPFKHNDPDSLERIIRRHGPGIIGVESVYSTSGSICPLRKIVTIAERFGCVVIVDESHSLGVFGPEGEGLTASLGIADRVHFRTASLSKAFAGRGGIIAGSARHIEFYRYEAFPAIFSSAVLPFEAVGFSAALSIIKKENGLRKNVQANANYLREALDEMDYNVLASKCQIISLVPGEEDKTIILRDALEARGVFGSVFCAPATAKNKSLVRFSVSAGLTTAELDHIIDVCYDIRDLVGMHDWRSTRELDREIEADPLLIQFRLER